MNKKGFPDQLFSYHFRILDLIQLFIVLSKERKKCLSTVLKKIISKISVKCYKQNVICIISKNPLLVCEFNELLRFLLVLAGISFFFLFYIIYYIDKFFIILSEFVGTWQNLRKVSSSILILNHHIF